MTSPTPFLEALTVSHLNKTFGATRALSDIHLRIAPGEMVSLIGPSGAGKSTLLKHFSGVMTGDSQAGEVTILGQTVQRRGEVNVKIRDIRSRIGFIFQQFNLVGRLRLFTNVLTGSLSRVPTWRSLLRIFPDQEQRMAMQSLARVGMAEYADQRAKTLSGGQQQRAAIARALTQQSEIIIADEPIASLDPESARKVMQLLKTINLEDKVTVLVSLHQVDFAMRFCDRCIGMKDGRIVYDGPTSALTPEILQDIYGSEYAEAGFETVQAQTWPNLERLEPVEAAQ
jgi:phosphonate transport system ATP-binding protein